MSNHLFTLFYGDKIQIAPQMKIIPAENFSQTLSAEEMVEHVKAEAKKYRMEIIAACEQLKEQAQKEGFEEGYKEWASQLASLEAEILKVRKELSHILAPVALKAAKKIVGRELKLSEETIVDIVSNVLKSVAQHKKISIYANPKDLIILDSHRSRLKEIFESLESLSLRPREDIEPGGCVIETEGGIIDAKLENQWKVLEKAFEAMFTKETIATMREEAKLEKSSEED